MDVEEATTLERAEAIFGSTMRNHKRARHGVAHGVILCQIHHLHARPDGRVSGVRVRTTPTLRGFIRIVVPTNAAELYEPILLLHGLSFKHAAPSLYAAGNQIGVKGVSARDQYTFISSHPSTQHC